VSQVFLKELGVGEPDHMLGVGSGTHAQQTARIMERLEPLLTEVRPDPLAAPLLIVAGLIALLVGLLLLAAMLAAALVLVALSFLWLFWASLPSRRQRVPHR
jgi:UDP-N-acetylglucosamine 2-epimerase